MNRFYKIFKYIIVWKWAQPVNSFTRRPDYKNISGLSAKQYNKLNRSRELWKVVRRRATPRVGFPTMANQKAVSHSARPCRSWTLRTLFRFHLRSRARSFLLLVAVHCAHRSCLDPKKPLLFPEKYEAKSAGTPK